MFAPRIKCSANVFFFISFRWSNFSRRNFRINWSDFHHIFTKWSWIIDPTFFFRSLKGRCHGDQFYGEDRRNRPTHLHSSPWYSKTELHIAIPISKRSMRWSDYIVYEAEGRTPNVDQQFSYVRLAAPLPDTAVIRTGFRGAMSTQFCFTNSLGGGLLLCHAGYTLAFATHF